jgi:hypothetical protein
MWTRLLAWIRTRKGDGESLSLLPELPLAAQRVVDRYVRTISAGNVPRAVLWLSLREVATVR